MKTKSVPTDLTDHNSPIKRVDGKPPYNGHLWPLEKDSWWLGHEHRRFSGRWHLSVVGLNDGRYATTGCVYHIQKNSDPCEKEAQPCVFATRAQAIRVSAARLIETMRASRRWGCSWDTMQGKDLEFAINWVLAHVERETQSKPHRRVTVPEPLPPVPVVPVVLAKVTVRPALVIATVAARRALNPKVTGWDAL